MNKRKTLILSPILIVNIYILFTLLVYLLGPWNFSDNYKYFTSIFILVYLTALNFGFLTGIYSVNTTKQSKNIITEKFLINWLKYILVASILFNVVYIIRNTGGNFISFMYMYEQAFSGIVNPGEQYFNKFSNTSISSIGGGVFPKIYVILSPLFWASTPVSILYWNRLKLTTKLLVVLAIIIEIIKWISIGTNKGLIDLVIIFVTVILTIYIKKAFDSKLDFRKISSRIMILIFFGVLALVYFNSAIGSRIGMNYNALLYDVPINESSLFFKFLPESWHFFIIAISAYLTQGYYAISMSFQFSFDSTLGMGSSLFLYENLKGIIGEKIWENSYVYKLSEIGWDQQVNWHSLYLWLANDWSYFGVIPIMFLLGLCFSIVWKEFLSNKNLISLILLPLYVMIFIYSPANNQVMQTPNLFVSFWMWNFVFLFSKLKKQK
ncbi:hypothetical protein [Exiguobacterium sp. USCH10]|uniref:hypothetical protein n=1 Tax=Exiguobacterium sp. USCH10 TaxID=3024839 RepID=UPI0030A89D8E